MSSPWSTIVVPEAKDLQDIISEELKDSVQRKNAEYVPTCHAAKWKYDMTDEELAKILQEEYDTTCCEDDNTYDSAHCKEDCDILYNSGSEDEEDSSDKIYYEKFNSVMKRFDPIPLYNCKHPYGDANSKKCKHVMFDVDNKTKLVLNKMIENKVFDSVTCIFESIGKETIILHAKKYLESLDFSTIHNYIVKVFQYPPVPKQVKYDHKRSCYVPVLLEKLPKPVNTRPLREKVRREAIYLQRLKKAQIPCPEVITLKHHVIVLSLIGETTLALSLKDSHLDDLENAIAYEQMVKYMKLMYQECNLIHTNLSEENILWHKNCCYVISLGKALEPHEEDALQLLFEDCTRVCNFFTMAGVPKVIAPDELFVDITACSFLNKVGLTELKENAKKKKKHF